MALPEVKLTITDPNLGIVPQAIDGITAAVGMSSSGTANTVYSFGDKQALKTALGTGPLVEYAAHLLDVAGGPIYCVPATQATAGSAGTVTKVGTGTPVMTVAGAARDAYEAIITIVQGGALGVGSFKFSLDGGDTNSPEIVIPASGTYAIPDSGLTLTFPAGTYVVADTYSFACTAPAYDATGLASALDALLADPREWRFVAIVGEAANASAAATLAATVKTKLDSAATNYRYVRGFMAANDTDSNLISGFASFESGRVAVCAGFAEVSSSVSGRVYKRSSLLPIAARAAKAPIHEDLGRIASKSLPGVGKLIRDERATPGLDGQRFATLRSFVGLPGSYITTGRTMAAQTSDYQRSQRGFVIDAGCRALRTALLVYLNDTFRVDAVTGFIFEVDAQAMEAEIKSHIEAVLVSPGHASAVEVNIKRDENILSSETLRCKLAVIPLGEAHAIEAEVGLKNPAFTPVAA
jgi:hypothetical protein